MHFGIGLSIVEQQNIGDYIPPVGGIYLAFADGDYFIFADGDYFELAESAN